MGAGEAGQGKLQLPRLVAIMELLAIGGGVPFPALGKPDCTRCRRGFADAVAEPVRIMLGDQRHALLGDARFLGGYPFDAVAEELLMVEPELRDAGDHRVGNDVGRVEPPAEPHFDDAGVGRDPSESEEGGGGGHFEEARLHPFRDVEHLLQQLRQERILDQLAGDPDPLVEPDEMRAGIDMGLQP